MANGPLTQVQIPDAMKTLTNLFVGTPLLAAAALINTSALCAADFDRIMVSGQILLDGAPSENVQLTVMLDGISCATYQVRANGGFKFSLPAETMAVLHFSKLGYLSKDIVVDTRNALCSTAARKRNHAVAFDVQMQPAPFMERTFANPVGTITFIRGSGLMKVEHDRTLIKLPGGMDLALLRESE